MADVLKEVECLSPLARKGTFMLTLGQFRTEFEKEVLDRGITWLAKGFYGSDGRVYPFGTDTKVLSTVFEAFCAPVVLAIAHQHGYKVTFAKQTVYPDFTLTPEGMATDRIAIDVKTTYQKTPAGQIKFTLGSYTSFLRNGTKNISFPYSQYSAHWVIGFVYRRRQGVAAKVYEIQKPEDMLCPYEDVRYFIQEKHKIVGTTPGSGNTTNIGSFPTSNIEDLREGRGPFAKTGEKAVEEYWRNYGR
jgi:hypothetical protein